MSGTLSIVGIGPGDPGLIVPEATLAIEMASDLVGYGPYLDRVASRPEQARHSSENGAEMDRALLALRLAEEGREVALISSGDAGAFGMATTVFEAMETGLPAWRGVTIRVVPGISAIFAVAARVGAPLGHDFCVLSLSDNLKPWSLVRRRLLAAAEGDFVIALYNPASRARPWQLTAALNLLGTVLPATVPVVLATAVTQETEQVTLATLESVDPTLADMRTLVLIGSRSTRWVHRPDGTAWVYTPRQGVETESAAGDVAPGSDEVA